MRILGLDVGEVRIGVAMSDPMQIITKPFEVIDRKKVKALNRLREIILEYEIEEVVVGMPYQLDGTIGPQAEKIQLFAQKLFNKMEQRIRLHFIDERLTTVEAHDFLYQIKAGDRRQQRSVVDKVAAAIILESYLKQKKAEEKNNEKSVSN